MVQRAGQQFLAFAVARREARAFRHGHAIATVRALDRVTGTAPTCFIARKAVSSMLACHFLFAFSTRGS